MRCKACHYSLLNLTEPRCPECGRAFDPLKPYTYLSGPPPLLKPWQWWLLFTGSVLFLIAFVLWRFNLWLEEIANC